jgi:hypothetical protein
MTKTATITCEFEYKLCIGQLAQQDAKLTKEVLEYGCIQTNEFYRIAENFYGEVIPESELDRLANLVKDSLCEKLKTSLPGHFVSNGGAKIADISVTTFYYRDKVFVDPRSLKVYMVVYICVSIEVTLDNEKSIDREKLFKLIANRYADFAWHGELSRYTIGTQFGELEIEYR